MIQFLKDSVRELKHVVWPTRKETQKYFLLVITLLILFGTYLFIFSNIFSTIIFGLKDLFGLNLAGNTSINSSLTDEEIDALFSDEATIDITPEETWTGSESETWTGELLPETQSGATTE